MIDTIPSPTSLPLRLVECRVCWELHAMLRINKIPYTVESSELPFAMDRPLPLLVHGEYVYASRNQVLEHVALYRPSASQSSDREYEEAASGAATAFSDDATLSAYFEKMEALLLHWKRLRGLDAHEDTSSLPFMHSLALWLQGSVRSTCTWAAAAHVMPDLGDDEVLLRLQDFYAALNRQLATILEVHGFIGTALCLPEIAVKLREQANVMLYYKNMARELFSNPDAPEGGELKEEWDRNTLDVLRLNPFARQPTTRAALLDLLEFDMSRAAAKEDLAQNNMPVAAVEEDDKGPRSKVLWSQLSTTASKSPSVPELVGSQRWGRTVPLTGVVFALIVSAGVLSGYLLHRR